MTDSPTDRPNRSGVAPSASTLAELYRDEKLFRLLVEQVSDYAIFALDPDGRIVSWNIGAERIKGYKADEVLGKRFSIFFTPEDQAIGKPDMILRTAAAEGRYQGEGWRVRKDGSRFWAHVTVTALHDTQGRLLGFATIVRDMTEQQRAEESARALIREQAARAEAELAREKTAAILEGISDGFVTLDRDWRFVFVNESAELILGKTADELVGRSIWEMFPELGGSRFEAEVRRSMEEQVPVHFEMTLDTFHGWLEANVSPMPDGISISFRDITERKRTDEAERILAEAGRIFAESLHYESMLDRINRLVVTSFAEACVIDLVEDGEIRMVASAHRDPEMEPVLREFRARWSPEWTSPEPPFSTLRKGESILASIIDDTILERIFPDPEVRKLVQELGIRSAIMVPLIARGRVLGVIAIGSRLEYREYDAVDLALAEELARRAALAIDNALLYDEALAASKAKSDFLAIMSHELRTPLNAIIGYTEILEAGILGTLNERQKEQVDRIGINADRLLRLIEEILTFSRIETGSEIAQLERTDATELLRSVARAIEPQARLKGLDFQADIPDEPMWIMTDPKKVRQILMHLLDNAVRFTDRGIVELRGKIEDETLVLQVRDTGIGIGMENQERIFEPFWQVEEALTRQVGGTGLGLAVARRLAEILGGDVSVESQPGAGSLFTIRLPVRGPDTTTTRGDRANSPDSATA